MRDKVSTPKNYGYIATENAKVPLHPHLKKSQVFGKIRLSYKVKIMNIRMLKSLTKKIPRTKETNFLRQS